MTISSPRRLPAAVAALAAAGALVLSGCGTSAGTSSGGAASTATPKAGGDLKVAIDADPICLDPSQSNLIASGVIGRQLVDSLLFQDPETSEFKPWLAESWTANADATGFSFVLREGATFSDGAPVDATAVKTFFDQVAASAGKNPTGAGFLAGYKGTSVADATHLTVEFAAPNAPFLTGAASRSLGILSPSTVNTTFEDRCLGKGLIGSGPFVLDSFTPGENARITGRKDYNWAPAGAAHQGAPYLDSVTYTVSAEPSVRSGSLKSGQVDVATTIQSQDEASLSGGGFTIASRVNPGVLTAVSANLSGTGLIADGTIREALQLAIDREDISNVVLSPSYGVAKSVLGETTPGFKDLSAELAADPEGAKKLLEDNGWKTGADGIREKDGKRLSLSVLYFYQTNVYEYLQQQLRAVGIDLVLNQVTAAVFSTEMRSGKTDLVQASFSRPDADILRTVFGQSLNNSTFAKDGTAGNAEIQALLQQQRETTDTGQRAAIAGKIQDQLIERNWSFPLAQLVQVLGVSPDVTGLSFDSFSVVTFYDAGFVE
ncbi:MULTISPECIES: ABC transporter substrate-binding protein [unclassified Pseudarthrobacter]|uniref:ABC transporter substrate-binding protein n=1 Tax=unclassified Pseudarthrobacter TaxID=2647000 RepID=UPI003631796F